MQIGPNTNAIRGHQAYAQAAYADRLQAAAQQTATRTQSTSFKLGKFGVQYETEETVPSPATKPTPSPQEPVSHNLQMQGLKNSSLPVFTPEQELSALQKRSANRAYQQSQQNFTNQNTPRMLNAVV